MQVVSTIELEVPLYILKDTSLEQEVLQTQWFDLGGCYIEVRCDSLIINWFGSWA